jgi:germination protein M
MEVKSNRIIRRNMLASVLLLLPLLAACSQNKGTDSGAAAIDPPPAKVQDTMLQASSGQPDSEAKDGITVYLLDRNGYVAPMTLSTKPDAESQRSPAEVAVVWMTADKQLADQLPPGFSPILPEGTKINSVKQDTNDRSITIDFAAPFPTMNPAHERKMLEALVWTMTELPGIDKLKLTVEGKTLSKLPASGIPVGAVLTRSLGINLEHAKGVQISRSMGVTLYFSARSADGEDYFVPVTRLVERKPDRARAALEQLIQGPLDTKSLKTVLTSDKISVEQLSQHENTVNVSLIDSDWEAESPVPAEMMEAMVLTMTEVTGAPQVQVMMNGSNSFLDSDQRSYAEPVSRPTAINAVKR